MRAAPVIIVGAGPAGLAAAACLRRKGIPLRLLEQGPSLGTTFRNVYDSLRLHTGRHMSHLPGKRFARGTSLFPTRDELLSYLDSYARDFDLDVETSRRVTRAEPTDGGWLITDATGDVVEARAVVVATGIVANPVVPRLPGADTFHGEILHAAAYRRPTGYADKRVIVVGTGNSAGEIGAELVHAGAHVTVAARSGVHVVPKLIGPFPAQYVRYLVGMLPRAAQEAIIRGVQKRMRAQHGPPVLPLPDESPLDAIPHIGFQLVDCIRAGSATLVPAVPVSFNRTGVTLSDGSAAECDVVLFATGYRAALEPWNGTLMCDARGFALRRDRVQATQYEGLYFVGHNYDHTGGLMNIRRDAPLVARALAAERRTGRS